MALNLFKKIQTLYVGTHTDKLFEITGCPFSAVNEWPWSLLRIATKSAAFLPSKIISPYKAYSNNNDNGKNGGEDVKGEAFFEEGSVGKETRGELRASSRESAGEEEEGRVKKGSHEDGSKMKVNQSANYQHSVAHEDGSETKVIESANRQYSVAQS